MPFFYNDQTGMLLVTNFKVAYSTLKRQESLQQVVFHKHIAWHLLLHRLGRRRVVLLVRHPRARFESFFADKFRRHPRLLAEGQQRNLRKWQDCQELFFPHLGIDGDAPMRTVADRLQQVAPEEVLRALPFVYKADPHLQPQHWVLSFAFKGIPMRVRPDHTLHIEAITESPVMREAGIDLNVRVNATRSFAVEVDDPDGVIERLYCEDFTRFGYSQAGA